jgi:hypothetical protein
MPDMARVVLGALLGALLIAATVPIVWYASKRNSTLTVPVSSISGTNGIGASAEPSSSITTIVQASLATNATFAVRVTKQGVLRVLQLKGSGTFSAGDFIVFGAGTIGPNDLPPTEPLATFASTAGIGHTWLTNIKLVVFPDGSLLVGQDQYGYVNAAVEITPFDAQLVSRPFVLALGPALYAAAEPAKPVAPVQNGNTTNISPPVAPTWARNALAYAIAFRSATRQTG